MTFAGNRRNALCAVAARKHRAMEGSCRHLVRRKCQLFGRNDGDLSAPIATLIHGCPQSTHTRQRCPRLSCTNFALTAQQLPRKAQVVQTQISKWRSPSAASPGIRGGQQFLAQGFGLKHDDGSCLLAARKNGPSFRAGMAQVVGRYGSSFKAAGIYGAFLRSMHQGTKECTEHAGGAPRPPTIAHNVYYVKLRKWLWLAGSRIVGMHCPGSSGTASPFGDLALHTHPNTAISPATSAALTHTRASMRRTAHRRFPALWDDLVALSSGQPSSDCGWSSRRHGSFEDEQPPLARLHGDGLVRCEGRRGLHAIHSWRAQRGAMRRQAQCLPVDVQLHLDRLRSP